MSKIKEPLQAGDIVNPCKSEELEEDDTGGRWGWFGFTPDCLQRLNTGYTWGIAIVFTNIATTFVVMGLLGTVLVNSLFILSFNASIFVQVLSH